MAFTPQDLQAIDAAIASGEMTVSSNGRSVTYRSIADLFAARAAIARALSQQAAPGAGSAGYALASFADD